MTVRLLVATLAASVALPAADPRLLDLLMPDAKVIAGINVQQTLAGAWGQYLLAQLPPDDADFQQLLAKTGFDPRRDVNEILAASTAIPGSKTGLVLARGNFDVPRILAAIQSMGLPIENFNGVAIVNQRRESLAFLDASVVIAGDAASVREAVGRRASAAPLDPAIVPKVNQLSLAHDAWALSLAPFDRFLAAGPTPQAPLNPRALQKIVQASGGIKFGALVRMSAEATAQTDADAAALADVVRLMAALVQMNSGNNSPAELTALLKNLNVSAQANVVSVSLDVPEDQFERLLRPSRRAR